MIQRRRGASRARRLLLILLAVGACGMAALLLVMVIIIQTAGTSPSSRDDFSRDRRSAPADFLVDSIEVNQRGEVQWQRSLRMVNRGPSAISELRTRFPAASFLPFNAGTPEGNPVTVSAAARRESLLLFLRPPNRIERRGEARLQVHGRARGLVRVARRGDNRARLTLPCSTLADSATTAAVVIRLPPQIALPDVRPAGSLSWTGSVTTPAGIALIWPQIEPRHALETIGVDLPASAFERPLPADFPLSWSRISFAAVLAGLVALLVGFIAWKGPEAWHEPALALAIFAQFLICLQPLLVEDNMGYLAYARSLWFDGDLDLVNDFHVYNSDGIFTPNPLEPPGPTGASVMLAPFFALGAGFQWLLQLAGTRYPANGYSWPYLAAVSLGGFFYCWAGLLLSYRMARDAAGARPAFAAVLAAAFGTNLFLVTSAWTASTHAPSFFLVTAFLRAWSLSRDGRSPGTWALLGLLGGLATQTRYQNVAFLLLPLLDLRRIRSRNRACAALLLFGLATGLGLCLQFGVWSVLHGEALVDNYGVGESRFGRIQDRLPKLLFGREGGIGSDGLLVGMPLLAVAWGALALRWRRLPEEQRYLAAMLALQVLVVSSYEIYWGRLLYGSAYLVNCTAVTVLGLAHGLAAARRSLWPRPLLAALLILACLAHLRLEVKQQAFEQLPFTGDTSTTWKLKNLLLLQPAIETGHYRLLSGNFGHLIRELCTPGGETLPVLLLAGMAVSGMALSIAGRPRLPSWLLALVLGGYTTAVCTLAVDAAKRGRARDWTRISDRSTGTSVDETLVHAASGSREFVISKPGLYRRIWLITKILDGHRLEQGLQVADIIVIARDGRETRFPLRAGIETADSAALRPEGRHELLHSIPWDRVAHQWRTRDASSNYYWGLSFATLLELAAGADIVGVRIEPRSTEGWLAVSGLVLSGAASTAPRPLP